MDGFSIGKILSGLGNHEIFIKKVKREDSSGINSGNTFSSAFSQAKPAQTSYSLPILADALQMNQIASMDRSIYIKNLLGLPQTLGDLLRAAQNNNPVDKNTLILNDLNADAIKNQKILSQIFDESMENLPAVMQNAQQQQALPKDAASLIFGGMIHLPALSELILRNSKQAVAGLIIAMASASKGGMTNEQIQETLSIINSCVAMAESGNPAQTLKSVMLLYLPWLPLNQGVGFDLEVETQDGENDSNDSKLTVLIQTKNFGNVKGVFTLTTSNSVDAYVICSESFPKNLLKQQLLEDGKSHSMNTNIDIEAVAPKKEEIQEHHETKVNLSATNEMNPYLLLMVHSFIRTVIYIDSNNVSAKEEEPIS